MVRLWRFRAFKVKKDSEAHNESATSSSPTHNAEDVNAENPFNDGESPLTAPSDPFSSGLTAAELTSLLNIVKQKYYALRALPVGAGGLIIHAIRKLDVTGYEGYESLATNRVCIVKVGKDLRREVEILRQMPPHPRIVSLLHYDAYDFNWFSMPLISGIDLEKFTTVLHHGSEGLPMSFVYHFMVQIAEVILFLHRTADDEHRGFGAVAHNDMHFSNIILTTNYTRNNMWPDLVVIDFDRATSESFPPVEIDGTQHYKSEPSLERAKRLDWENFGMGLQNLVHGCGNSIGSGSFCRYCARETVCPKRKASGDASQQDEWFNNWMGRFSKHNQDSIDELAVLTEFISEAKRRYTIHHRRDRRIASSDASLVSKVIEAFGDSPISGWLVKQRIALQNRRDLDTMDPLTAMLRANLARLQAAEDQVER